MYNNYPKHPVSAALESIFWKLLIMGVIGSALWLNFGKEYIENKALIEQCLAKNNSLDWCEILQRNMTPEEFYKMFAPYQPNRTQ